MSVRMRHTREHTGNRRSHHALQEPRLTICANCKASHVRHQMCGECGKYRGREVVNVAEKVEKKEKKMKAKALALGEESKKEEDPKAVTEEQKPLNASELSKK